MRKNHSRYARSKGDPAWAVFKVRRFVQETRNSEQAEVVLQRARDSHLTAH